MNFNRTLSLVYGCIVTSGLAIAGCSQSADQNDSSATNTSGHDHEGHDHDAEGHQHADHDNNGEPTHGGWWCYEHAVPEEQCAMCDSKLAAELREKGDWCEEHNRPDSLCFKCNPENATKFVALYEAKYGKQPPAATD